MSGIYDGWALHYDALEGTTSVDTWEAGIIPELERLGCAASRLLDLGAGTGIGRRCMLRRFPNARITCLDQSAEMLERGAIPAVDAIVGDMASFDVDGTYDFVVSGFDALNYLPKHAFADCLASVARALRQDGHLVFDYSSRKVLQHDWADLVVHRDAGDGQLRVVHRYEAVVGRTRIDLHLSRDGQEVWTERHYHYSLDPFDIDELAVEAGLVVRRVRDIDARTFSPGCATHVYVLQRT